MINRTNIQSIISLNLSFPREISNNIRVLFNLVFPKVIYLNLTKILKVIEMVNQFIFLFLNNPL